MLQKSTAIVIVLAVSSLLLPLDVSGQPHEQGYQLALGMREGVTGEGLGLGLFLFPNDEDRCRYECLVGPMGGARFWPDLPYDHLDVQITDAHFAQPATEIVFRDPSSGLISNEPGHAAGPDCGVRALRDLPVETELVTVFVYSVHLTSSLDVCLASTGTMELTFF